MVFNKSKSMKNAEKYLTQGRIDAAINEYKQIVQNEPKDVNSQNMLGDLYVKAGRTDSAVHCYRKVAEHYSGQGFAKKAIAVYNKIYKLTPDSQEIVGKLAELYQVRGSIAEARAHYKRFAEHLEKEGKNIEVLEVWHKLADLDPSDSAICLKIAEIQQGRNQKDDAARAYFDAATRLGEKGDHGAAIKAFKNALEVNEKFSKAVRGLVRAYILDGSPGEAANLLEDRLDEDPYNKEYTHLLIECFLEMNEPASAERVVIGLVEREPANYPKLIDLAAVYLKNGEPGSAVRILSMVSEHLLAGGDAQTLESNLLNVLESEPANVDALRLLARCYSWQREQQKLRETLKTMAEAARELERYPDERWALSQYLVLVPHDSEKARRFEQLVDEYGHADSEDDGLPGPGIGNFASPSSRRYQEFGLESEAEFAAVNEGSGLIARSHDSDDEALVPAMIVDDPGIVSVNDDAVTVLDGTGSVNGSRDATSQEYVKTPLRPGDEVRLDDELIGIRFYIEQGYDQLADRSLAALEDEFGNRREIAELRQELYDMNGGAPPALEEAAAEENDAAEDTSAPAETPSETELGTDPLRDIANDLGFDAEDPQEAEDFEEHFNHGLAYKEMDLVEEAIREFQAAAECVTPESDDRKFYSACTMLGLCFLEREMPKLSLIWFRRAYDECELSPEEKQAVEYELGNVFELLGQFEEAIEHFEEVYAADLDYRDVAERLEALRSQLQIAG